jgi:hypothetical protein
MLAPCNPADIAQAAVSPSTPFWTHHATACKCSVRKSRRAEKAGKRETKSHDPPSENTMHHENLKSINMKNKTSAKILPLPAHDDAVEMVKPGNAGASNVQSGSGHAD